MCQVHAPDCKYRSKNLVVGTKPDYNIDIDYATCENAFYGCGKYRISVDTDCCLDCCRDCRFFQKFLKNNRKRNVDLKNFLENIFNLPVEVEKNVSLRNISNYDLNSIIEAQRFK